MALRGGFTLGSLAIYPLVGDRETANQMAAQAGAGPFGHMVLAIAIMNCYCGAPFDIETTPNFD